MCRTIAYAWAARTLVFGISVNESCTLSQSRVHLLGNPNFSLSVQVRSANPRGSQGFIAVTMLLAKSVPAKPGGDFPRLGGSKVLTDVESMGEGKLAKLLILSNRFSVASNVSYYETAMSKQGWTRSTNYGGPQPGGEPTRCLFTAPIRSSISSLIRRRTEQPSTS